MLRNNSNRDFSSVKSHYFVSSRCIARESFFFSFLVNRRFLPTGVYVNQTRSTHHEGFCSIAGMQYRISSTSHTQTAATAVAAELHEQVSALKVFLLRSSVSSPQNSLWSQSTSLVYSFRLISKSRNSPANLTLRWELFPRCNLPEVRAIIRTYHLEDTRRSRLRISTVSFHLFFPFSRNPILLGIRFIFSILERTIARSQRSDFHVRTISGDFFFISTD